jgi:hypothetical protein
MLKDIRHLIYSLAAEDAFILKSCEPKVSRYFLLIGLIVLFIYLLCAVSIGLFIYSFINNYFAIFFLTLFISLFIINLYLFILHNISPNLLPNNATNTSNFFESLLKLGFLIFLAIAISKPIEIFIFKDNAAFQRALEGFKDQKLEDFKINLNELTTDRLNDLNDLYNRSSTNIERESFKIDIEHIHEINQQRIVQMGLSIGNSFFFIEKTKILFNIKESKYVTFFISFLFILPWFLKIILRNNNPYYELKKDIEMRMVREDYVSFIGHKNSLLYRFKDYRFNMPPKYLDPPFNTKLIRDNTIMNSSKKLIEKIYG